MSYGRCGRLGHKTSAKARDDVKNDALARSDRAGGVVQAAWRTWMPSDAGGASAVLTRPGRCRGRFPQNDNVGGPTILLRRLRSSTVFDGVGREELRANGNRETPGRFRQRTVAGEQHDIGAEMLLHREVLMRVLEPPCDHGPHRRAARQATVMLGNLWWTVGRPACCSIRAVVTGHRREADPQPELPYHRCGYRLCCTPAAPHQIYN